MYGHRVILTTWMSIIILSISRLKLTNTTLLTCSSDFRSDVVPLKPPKTNIGSFMVYQNFNAQLFLNPIRDVYIFWQEIDDKNICGGTLEYQVFCIPDNTDNENYNKTIMKKTYTNYVKFENLSTTLEYKCEVYSMIDNDLSSEYSIVDIPKEWDRDPKTLSLTRTEFNEEDVIELSWSPQTSFEQIINYTLFWCEIDINRSYECIGFLNWINISSLYTSYNITVTDKKINYRFFISVNSETFLQDQFDGYNEVVYRSSGMILESCTLQSNKLPGKILNIEINVIASRYIQMFWALDCSEKVGTVKGYRVLYCRVDQNSQCIEPLIEKKIYADNTPYAKILVYERITVFAIAKLQPLTSYMFTISLLTNNGEGLPSDPLFVTTLEEGEYSNISSSVIFWLDP